MDKAVTTRLPNGFIKPHAAVSDRSKVGCAATRRNGDGPIRRGVRRLVVAVCCATAVGCVEAEAPGIGQVGYVGGFFGGAASDEPRATLVGREILTIGGSAADAAVAMAFTLAVTMPTRAGLGSEGVCLIHDPGLGATEVLDFLSSSAAEGATVSVPALARGMAALHARYGRLDWRGLLTSAENLARLGHSASRATRNDLAVVWPLLQRDREAMAALAGPDGQPPSPTWNWVQPSLATVISQIRLRGAGVMYAGPLARNVVNGYIAAAGPAALDLQRLNGFLPEWRTPAGASVNNQIVYVAPPSISHGLAVAQALGAINELDPDLREGLGGRTATIARVLQAVFAESVADDPDDLPTLQLEDSAIEALAERIEENAAPEKTRDMTGFMLADRGATGFLAVARDGSAVACTVSLNGPAGLGRMPQGLGFFPGRPRPGKLWNTPLLIANDANFRWYYAAAGDGGATGLGALIKAASRSFLDGVPLREALAESRVTIDAVGGRVGIERNAPGEAKQGLADAGISAGTTPLAGRVHVIYCPSGLPEAPEERLCGAEVDPRTDGLAALAE